MEFNHDAMEALGEKLQALDFDTVFTLSSDCTIREEPTLYAPSVFHDEQHDIEIDGTPGRNNDEWSALTGMTGQYSYNGAVMHASEFIGCGIAHRLWLETEDGPATFVIVPVEVYPDEDEPEDPAPAGWAILQRR